MKKFKDFLKESVDNDYQTYLDDVKNSIITDFGLSEQQTNIYIKKNEDTFKRLFEDDIEPKEAITIVKLP